MNRQILRLFTLLACTVLSPIAAAEAVQSAHIEVELVSEVTFVQPGNPFWVALRLEPEEDWHIYWRNPGETGKPPNINWSLPEGTTSGDIHWPYPQKILYKDMVDYGYKGETLLLVPIEPPKAWNSSSPLRLEMNAFWLVCSDTCIPGNADLILELPVSPALPTPDPHWRRAFEATRARLPVAGEGWQSAFTFHEGSLYLEARTASPLFAHAEQIDFFPYQAEIVEYNAPQQARWQPSELALRQTRSTLFTQAPGTLEGVIVVKAASGTSAYSLSATSGLVARPALFDAAASRPPRGSNSLFLVILSAVMGGILLNLMPCVFPVLSLKAINLLECAQISHTHQRLHGVAYSLGTMLFFAAVAGVLLLLRAGGATIGWGFQLQSPWFVALMAYLLFVMGLSFSGVLEFGTSFMGVGNDLTRRTGYAGSFFTGALAAVVASPCTAPFMGSAIAFALSQSAVTALSVFLALGFGMAFPFLLISCSPSLARLLPRPGPWMNILRQFMAFPLYLTCIWLLWVLGRQTDASGMAATLGGMLLLAFGIWVLQLRAHTVGHWRRFVEGLTVVATLGAFAILHLPLLNEPALGVAHATGKNKLDWEPYSAERLAELRAENRPVFVNITADWCISCIANERVGLSFPAVRKAFAEKNIARLKGDWTSRDPLITKVLQAFGREGVPLYVVYPVEPDAEPMVLPQFLTPGIVLDALRKAAGEKQAVDELRDGYPSALQSPI